jgi:hypothetical protein
MLVPVYARCVAGMEDVWIARMDITLCPQGHLDADQQQDK